jgi:hypothetical protein
MQLKIEEEQQVRPEIKTVAVITPTVGNECIIKCLKSVADQDFKGKIKHYVVPDGWKASQDFEWWTGYSKWKKGDGYPEQKYNHIELCNLSDNVGKAGGNWYGHRIYAAFSYLVNADAICFLDEDNWFEPNHISSLAELINTHDLDWAFSHRKIFDKAGKYLLDDNCESLGVHPAWVGDQVFHVDTSSYMVRTDIATRVAGAWHGQWGADRQYFAMLVEHFPKATNSKKHTLCYRLDGNPNSVTEDFFRQGNEAMIKKYGSIDKLPWLV